MFVCQQKTGFVVTTFAPQVGIIIISRFHKALGWMHLHKKFQKITLKLTSWEPIQTLNCPPSEQWNCKGVLSTHTSVDDFLLQIGFNTYFLDLDVPTSAIFFLGANNWLTKKQGDHPYIFLNKNNNILNSSYMKRCN